MTIFHQIKSDTQQIKAVRLRSEINNSPYTQAEFLDILLTGNSLEDVYKRQRFKCTDSQIVSIFQIHLTVI